MTKTTVNSRVNRDADGNEVSTQYILTVPKGIAEAMDLDGAEVEWSIKSGNTLELTKTEDND